jgi:hypothetical protein
VSKEASPEDGQPLIGISQEQLKQLLSLLDNKKEGPSSHANVVSKPGLFEVTSRSWIINSGATYHISSKLFSDKHNKCTLPPVLLPNGEKAKIVAKGSLPLNSVYYLHNVLCVPTFKVDLISVSHLTRDLNCLIIFFPYWCLLQDLVTRRMIGLGKQHNGLYYLVALATKQNMTNPSSTITQPTCHLTISSTNLRHNRLGHTSPSRLRFIAKFFKKFSIQSNTICSVCHLAKQSRLPFNPSVISSTKPFAMIHCDIWGPYRHLLSLVLITSLLSLMILHVSHGFFNET